MRKSPNLHWPAPVIPLGRHEAIKAPPLREEVIPHTPPIGKKDALTISREKLLELHNQARSEHGASPLAFDKEIQAYAQKHAEDMARTGSLEHSNLDFQGSWKGENIADGQTTEAEVMSDWMHSSGHRANILRREFNVVGFGLAYADGTPYWCACFAHR